MNTLKHYKSKAYILTNFFSGKIFISASINLKANTPADT